MRDGSFDNPAFGPEAGAVGGAASGDDRHDPARAEFASVLVVVIAAVGKDPVEAVSGAADLAARRRDGVDEREQLGDVVAVGGRDRHHDRNAVRVAQDVSFDAVFRAIGRVRAGEVPPKTARWDPASTTPVVQSISPAAFNSSKST